MYYSSGNYEAFARPKKPEGVDNKSAYIVGSGLAALTAACYLVRDGQMKGEHVHVLEKGDLPGGACDGYKFENLGYVMRGGREMDNHFEVMWDLFRSIPSIETEGVSVLDEYYWLNKGRPPNYSPLPRDRQPRSGRAHRRQIRHLRQGRDGDHEALLHPQTSSCRTRRSPTSSMTRSFLPTSGSTGARCSPLKSWHSALEMKLYIRALYPPHRGTSRLHGAALHEV